MTASAIRCPTLRCAKSVERYGEAYHRVVARSDGPDSRNYPNATALCEGCGGYLDADGWHHRCWTCKRDDVPAGELAGLFVPHLCATCWQARVESDRRRGNFCLKCKATRSECCC